MKRRRKSPEASSGAQPRQVLEAQAVAVSCSLATECGKTHRCRLALLVPLGVDLGLALEGRLLVILDFILVNLHPVIVLALLALLLLSWGLLLFI